MTAHIRADVLHIGYPKAASTFVGRFLENHPEVTTDHNDLADLLLSRSNGDAPALAEKPCPDKIHVTRDEGLAESVSVIGESNNWQRYLFVPGAWDRVKDDIVIDPGETALRLHKVYPHAKILLLIREQADWLQSAYKFVMSQLPANKRSFADYCSTPGGIVFLQAGHFDRTIQAYIETFGTQCVHVLRFEDIVSAPKQFAAKLCAVIGISERPIPQERENDTHAQIAKIRKFLPIIERLPKSLKTAVKPYALGLPGGRGAILSSRDIRVLRGIYALSNQRTEKLISQLSTAVR